MRDKRCSQMNAPIALVMTHDSLTHSHSMQLWVPFLILNFFGGGSSDKGKIAREADMPAIRILDIFRERISELLSCGCGCGCDGNC